LQSQIWLVYAVLVRLSPVETGRLRVPLAHPWRTERRLRLWGWKLLWVASARMLIIGVGLRRHATVQW
jgi:hypothetical protein